MPDLYKQAQDITHTLGGKWNGRYGIACCPAHDDTHASLSIRPGDRAVIFNCYTGCTSTEVVEALKRIQISKAPSYSVKDSATGSINDFAAQLYRNAQANIRGTLADTYLRSRCITIHSNQVRFDPAARYRDENNQMQRAPALVAPYRSEAGLVAIQRTFLDPSGNKLKCKDSHGRISSKRFIGSRYGGLCRLFPPAKTLGLGEGVEEAYSTTILTDIPSWSIGGIENYASIQIPDCVEHLVIFTQHGKPAANAIKRGWDNLTGNGRRVTVEFPDKGGDWNDMLCKRDQQSLASSTGAA
ncbi:DUF7146 domain-containing protein [Alterisphingorhabdus coralli]|uniref:Toprim domain-containing protein n=1 Tax=Alterisphingorhabdus coralli TaxID=3071408 RepID=A0AA97F982_9SPHN|nr:toprim domain-containing protein [Parasphingorhabdus sp. SCSIO 66989]WOE76734.1 toprim domain-containing protein [Parasphingorhabdus sp. SCSIO 66989]